MDKLKIQTQQALNKIIVATDHQEREDRQNNLDNPEGEHAVVTCKQLLDLYSHSLESKEKMLVEVSLNDELERQMTTIEFKDKLKRIQKQMDFADNQFKPQGKEQDKNKNGKPPTRGRRIVTQPKKSEPSVERHPQYYRIDHEICSKLYLAYKGLGIGPSTKPGMFSFEEKEQQKCSMNYQKIIQIFKDINIKLEINQKLMITRSIKKFCFNQNFISQEEFIKLFKVIVHGLGYRQNIFQELLQKKSLEIMKNSADQSKKQMAKPRKNYRFKTDGSIPQIPLKNTLLIHEKRGTDFSESSFLEGKRKDGRNSSLKKAIGINNGDSNVSSYLVKAMQSQKIAKITWQSLFNMREDSMHHNIVIPDIAKNLNYDQL